MKSIASCLRLIPLLLILGLSACHTTTPVPKMLAELPRHFSTPTPNLWQQISAELEIPPQQCQRPLVQKEIHWYRSHKRYLRTVANRAKPYLHYIYQQTRQRHLPSQLVLLPAVESAYDPIAYSGVGAAGLWQFMPGTASGFGIKQNWWYDGRRDLVASTNAALDYLSYLNHFFDGDWLLAIAAYDAGEGTVAEAVSRNAKQQKPVDYWSLSLPGETRTYIPRVLALTCVIKHADRYGIKLPFVANKAYLTRVDVGSQIDLEHAARLAKMPLQQLYHLNPGFNRWATDPNGPFQLVLPIDKAEQFKASLAHYPKTKRVSWHRHHIQQGDTLGQIAHHYRTNVKLIKTVNRLKTNTIRSGHVLLIPHNTQHVNQYILKRQKQYFDIHHKPPGPERATHWVRPHETLWDIAKEYGVKTRDLRFWNKLSRKSVIHPKQKLVIWIPIPKKAHALPKHYHYTVKSGESLWTIAKRNKTTVKHLQKLNQLKQLTLRVGQQLLI